MNEARRKFLQWQTQFREIQELKNKLNFKFEDWDALGMFRTANGLGPYQFEIIKFKEKQEYINSDFGPNYYIISSDEGGVFKQEAIMGDPIHIILNNYVLGNMQGYVIRRCKEGDEMAEQIFKDAQLTVKVIQRLIKMNVVERV